MRTRLDGVPGFTIQGKRGSRGKAGGSTLIAGFNDGSTGADDYVLALTQAGATITDKDGNAVDSWTRDRDSVADPSVTVTVDSSLGFDRWGGTYGSDGSPEAKAANVYYRFEVQTDMTADEAKSTRIEATFSSKCVKAWTQGSCRYSLWDGADDADLHPYGYYPNFKPSVNFAGEPAGDFSVVLKDFGTYDAGNAYPCTQKILLSDVEGKVLEIWAYFKIAPNTYRKVFMGSRDPQSADFYTVYMDASSYLVPSGAAGISTGATSNGTLQWVASDQHTSYDPATGLLNVDENASVTDERTVGGYFTVKEDATKVAKVSVTQSKKYYIASKAVEIPGDAAAVSIPLDTNLSALHGSVDSGWMAAAAAAGGVLTFAATQNTDQAARTGRASLASGKDASDLSETNDGATQPSGTVTVVQHPYAYVNAEKALAIGGTAGSYVSSQQGGSAGFLLSTNATAVAASSDSAWLKASAAGTTATLAAEEYRALSGSTRTAKVTFTIQVPPSGTKSATTTVTQSPVANDYMSVDPQYISVKTTEQYSGSFTVYGSATGIAAAHYDGSSLVAIGQGTASGNSTVFRFTIAAAPDLDHTREETVKITGKYSDGSDAEPCYVRITQSESGA